MKQKKIFVLSVISTIAPINVRRRESLHGALAFAAFEKMSKTFQILCPNILKVYFTVINTSTLSKIV